MKRSDDLRYQLNRNSEQQHNAWIYISLIPKAIPQSCDYVASHVAPSQALPNPARFRILLPTEGLILKLHLPNLQSSLRQSLHTE